MLLFYLICIHQRNKYHMFQQKKTIRSSAAVSTLIINQHIRLISEGLCDTEDWSNDAENSVLFHINKLCFKVY